MYKSLVFFLSLTFINLSISQRAFSDDLTSWGFGPMGQLGNGQSHDRPRQYIQGNDWKAIYAGYECSFAIKTDGSLWAWGSNTSGKLGDGTTTNRTTPTRIDTSTNWKMISCGLNHTLGLKNDGTLWAWGENNYGQLGDGTNINRLIPTRVDGSTNWVMISRSNTGSHSMGIKSDGSLWAWGWNGWGQLGDGTKTNKLSPTKVDNSIWASISLGNQHTLGIKSDGSLWAWGANAYGQLGDGTVNAKSLPTQIGTSKNWNSISSGPNHSIGIQNDRIAWAWGENSLGQIGDGTSGTNRNSPVKVDTITNWESIECFGRFNFGRKLDGTIWTWGDNIYATFGDTTKIIKNRPANFDSISNWLIISPGYSHTLAIKHDGSVWSWGRNNFYQLGDTTNATHKTPTTIDSTKKWLSISSGFDFTLAVNEDGTLWGWGNNLYYTIGETRKNKDIPTMVDTSTNWLSVNCGNNHAVGIKKDASLWAWGQNSSGQVGDGSTNTFIFKPTKIDSLSIWKLISCGGSHTLGIKNDGTLWAWGANLDGQLGDGTTSNRNSPKKIGSDTNWISIAAFLSHSLGLKSDGTLWAWGSNTNGKLGDGTTTSRLTPKKIGSDTNWIKIFGTRGHYSLALKSDNTLWAWGSNLYGQLGNGTTTGSVTPMKIGQDTTWDFLTGSQFSTYGIKKDGTLWAWGRNQVAQLGDGTTTDRLTPKKIGTSNKWLTLSAADEHIIGVLDNSPIQSLDLPLNTGWNLISSNIQPNIPDTLNNILSDIEENLLIVKNNSGQVFIPSYDINTIGRWDITQGYLVYMSAVDTLTISGNTINPSENPIQLNAGWNTISYLRNSELSAELSFASITDNDNLLIAKTIDGKVYIPTYGINTIGNLKLGVAYKVYVTTNDILIYPNN